MNLYNSFLYRINTVTTKYLKLPQLHRTLQQQGTPVTHQGTHSILKAHTPSLRLTLHPQGTHSIIKAHTPSSRHTLHPQGTHSILKAHTLPQSTRGLKVKSVGPSRLVLSRFSCLARRARLVVCRRVGVVSSSCVCVARRAYVRGRLLCVRWMISFVR